MSDETSKILVLGNSVTFRGKETYAERIKGELVDCTNQTPNLLYTVAAAQKDLDGIDQDDVDLIVFNFGINELVMRTGNDLQLDVYTKLAEFHANKFFKDKMKKFKDVQERINQLFTPKEFEAACKKLFKAVKCKAVVIGINWFPEDHKTMGYAYETSEQTNKILQKCAKGAGLEFIDMWQLPIRTYDGVHLTEDGHKFVADAILGL